ncbi:MAG: hypothetical protein N2Z79_01395, partial [Candidatus Omnitrophica bacterium]|nr:hypothetical protein [Candidatus Omnitrophota bacterium]
LEIEDIWERIYRIASLYKEAEDLREEAKAKFEAAADIRRNLRQIKKERLLNRLPIIRTIRNIFFRSSQKPQELDAESEKQVSEEAKRYTREAKKALRQAKRNEQKARQELKKVYRLIDEYKEALLGNIERICLFISGGIELARQGVFSEERLGQLDTATRVFVGECQRKDWHRILLFKKNFIGFLENYIITYIKKDIPTVIDLLKMHLNEFGLDKVPQLLGSRFHPKVMIARIKDAVINIFKFFISFPKKLISSLKEGLKKKPTPQIEPQRKPEPKPEKRKEPTSPSKPTEKKGPTGKPTPSPRAVSGPSLHRPASKQPTVPSIPSSGLPHRPETKPSIPDKPFEKESQEGILKGTLK